jgi:hypothetical protein
MENTKVIADRSDIVAIADAVRSKTGKADELTLAEMPSEIQSISGLCEDFVDEVAELIGGDA